MVEGRRPLEKLQQGREGRRSASADSPDRALWDAQEDVGPDNVLLEDEKVGPRLVAHAFEHGASNGTENVLCVKGVLAAPGLHEVLQLEVAVVGPLEIHGVHIHEEEQGVGDGPRGGERSAFGGGMPGERRSTGGPSLAAVMAVVGGA